MVQSRCLGVIVVVGLLTVASAAAAAPQAVPSASVLMADGPVQSVQRFGDQLLLLGDFTHIGPYVGSGIGVDPASGAVDPGFPRFDGQVSDVIEDGSGGWYVGGQFYVEGGTTTQHLVHVLPSGALDPNFKSSAGDFVTALVLANGHLYAARYFEDDYVVIDPATGARIGYPKVALNQPSEIALAGGRLYVGGDGLSVLEPDTGVFDRGFECSCPRGQVGALAHDDSRLYVGNRHGRVYALDLVTGKIDTTFAPPPESSGTSSVEDSGPLVFAIDGDRLLVGGVGLRLGGPSSTLVALDKTTGVADTHFAAGFDQPVYDLVVRGDTIVASGGPLDDGAPRLTTLDRASGTVRDSVNLSLDGPVDALSGTGSRLFVGGRFDTRAGVKTADAAMVSARTGRLVPGFAVSSFSFDRYYPPNLTATDDSLVLWTADFDYDTSRTRLRMRTLSRTTGRRRDDFRPPRIAFNPLARTYLEPRYGGQYYDPVVLGAGDRIFVGHVLGDPSDVWPQSVIRVLNAATGRTVARYRLPLKGYLTALALRGNTLYAGGSFRRFRAGRPAHLATLALDPLTGDMDEAFDAHTHGPISAIGQSERRLYLTGFFDRIWPIRQRYAAAVDPVTGRVDPAFRPSAPRFDQFYNPFGTPFSVSRGVLNLPYRNAVHLVSATTGRRIRLPFSTDNLNALLRVGRRYYGDVSQYLAFPYDSGQRSFAGFLTAG